MKKILLLAITALLTMNVWGQQVDAQYLNPLNVSSDYKFIRFGNPTEYYAGFMYNIQNVSYGDGNDFAIFTYNNRDLVLSSGTGNVVLHPKNNGKVGIGTINPDAMLHISSGNIGVKSQYAYSIFEAIDAQLDITSSSDGTWGSTINFIEGNGASNTDVWSISRQTTNGIGNSSLRINYGTTNNHINPNVITFNANGNVGIGTTDPQDKLQIKGRLTLSEASSMYISPDMTQEGLTGHYIGTYSWGEGHKPIVIRNTVNSIIINTNGSVGIGTANTRSFKFAVDGKAVFEEVVVEMSDSWADFVFEDNYNLMSLKNLDQFIQVNKHLPEIPTTAEVEENGISIGEMNAKLLQKIEELTLYVIELKKENEEHSEAIRVLKNEIDRLKN